MLYAFCDFRNQRSVDPVAILATFLSELLRTYPCSITPDFDDLVDAEKKGRDPPQTVARLVPLIRKAAKRFRRTSIVLDGLDECEEREPLLELLPTFASDSGFNVFVASRTEQDIREAFSFADAVSLQTELGHVSHDILRHINRELQRRPQLARLSAEMQTTIRETLSSKASGMYVLQKVFGLRLNHVFAGFVSYSANSIYWVDNAHSRVSQAPFKISPLHSWRCMTAS